MAPPSRTSPQGLTRQLATPIVGLVAIVVLLTVTAIAGVLIAHHESEELVDRISPLRETSNRMTLAVGRLDAASGALADGATAQRVKGVRTSLAELGQAEKDLVEAAQDSGSAAVEDAVPPLRKAVKEWSVGWVQPALADGQAPEVGAVDALVAVLDANAAIAAEADVLERDLQERVHRDSVLIQIAVVMAALLGIAGCGFLVQRVRQETVAPLEDLAAVIARLRAGDSGARAAVRGPLEIRQIATALNMLADENVRGRDIEDEVRERLDELDRVRNDLVSTVSHELRTPLTSIRGYLELIQDQLYDDLSQTQVNMLGTIRRNLDRLNDLIGNLLVLSRAEESSLTVESLDLRGVANEVASDIRVVASGRDISVRTSVPPVPVIAYGDRSQLIRALSNLVANAVKFSRPGGVVDIRVRQEGNDGVIEVVDEGIGIPARDLPQLGARFYRASNAVKAEIQGTGLGLRIVQTILDQHGGTLAVDSLEGEGTTVTVRMPLRHAFPVLEAMAGTDLVVR